MHTALTDDVELARHLVWIGAKPLSARNAHGFSVLLWAEWHDAVKLKKMLREERRWGAQVYRRGSAV